MEQQLKNKRLVIAGGSGILGLSMAETFVSSGADVTILSRSVPKAAGPWKHRIWDGRTLGDWAAALEGCDAVVNLAGRTVNCVKTPDHRDEILRSRVESTRVLGEAMRAVQSPPPTWVQIGLPAMEWMVRIGAPWFLRTDPELVLYGRYVIPKRLIDEGFEFRFGQLEPALRNLHDRKN